MPAAIDDEIPVEPPEPPAPDDPAAAACPVVPLGHDRGVYVLISHAGQVRHIKARDIATRPVLDDLLGAGSEWAWTHFPRRDKDGNVVGIAASECGGWLMRACQAVGIWDAAIETRQPGVWPGEAGPIVHAGDAVLIGADWRVAGFRDGAAIYPAAPKVTRPGLPARPEMAQGLVQDLRLWGWTEPDAAPLLVAGWVGVAMLAAAAPWRPNLFVTGGTGAGKTALRRVLRAALPIHFFTTDTTRAGLYANLNDMPRAIVIDEAEGEEGSGRLLALLRSAGGSDGAHVNRGSQDGSVRPQMRLLAAVCMLAIGRPAMLPQDEGRFTVLDLLPPAAEDRSAAMAAAAERARKAAPALFARMLAGYRRWHETLGLVRAALIGAGCRPREADQLGALLSGYWTLVEDRPPRPPEVADMLRTVAPFVRTSEMVREDDGPQRCLQAFVSAIVITGTNQRRAVGELLAAAWSDDPEAHTASLVARDDLARIGIGVRVDGWAWLGNRAAGLSYVFRDTPWAEHRWRAELARLDGARPSGRVIRIGPRGGYVGHALGLPRALLLGEGVPDA